MKNKDFKNKDFKNKDLNVMLKEAMDIHFGKNLPKSAIISLEQMHKLIDDSEGPADVALALSLGLAMVLLASANPNSTLSIMLAAAGEIAEEIVRLAPDGTASAGLKFFQDLEGIVKPAPDKGKMQ